ncbi:MAG: hypothetical protein QOF92_4857 [Pseudonocardiales bacterium]|nr:hypothetical protein [Pseudonocardiales bacterium]
MTTTSRPGSTLGARAAGMIGLQRREIRQRSRRARGGLVMVAVAVATTSAALSVPQRAAAVTPLQVSVSDGRQTAYPGDAFASVVSLSNVTGPTTGPLIARESIGAGLDVLSASDGGQWDAVRREVTWPVPSIAHGRTLTRTAIVRARSDAPLAEPVVASVSVHGEGVSASASDEVLIEPEVEIAVTDRRDSARPGDRLSYAITITNPDPRRPRIVTLTDSFGAGLNLLDAGGGAVDPSGRDVTWRITVPGNAVRTLAVTAQVSGSGGRTLRNSVAGTTANSTYRAVDETAPATAQVRAASTVPSGMMTFLDQNVGGSWCWFEDERVIIDRAGQRMYAGVNTGTDVPGTMRMLEVDLATGSRRTVDLGRAEVDDHNTAAVWEAPNGEILTSWSRHGNDRLLRQHRRLTDGTWTTQSPVLSPSFSTYNNLYSVDSGRLLYDFSRTTGNDPHVQTSTDFGQTWTYRGRLLRDPEDRFDRWPYLKYTSNGVDRIDFMATPSHPRQTATEIYAGYIKNDTVYRSDGTPLGPVGSSIDVTRLTLVWAPPNKQTQGWDVDIAEDPTTGYPVLMFVRNNSFTDNRDYYARWDGTTWQVNEIAHAGTSFYSPENNYSGLAAFDPNDVNVVVISTDADPVTGAPLISSADGRRHREIYRGVRNPDATFTWTPLTSNSTVDNIRPVWTASPSGADALLWLRGRFTTFMDFSLAVVGIVHRNDGTIVTPAGYEPPPATADATVLAGNFDRHPTGDLLLNRPGTGAEELRLFDTHGGISRVPLQPGYDNNKPVVGDFNGDGQSDIYWYAPGDGTDHLWTQFSSAFVDSTPPQVRGTYQPLVGDFDGNGSDDIYWYAPGAAADTMWLSSSGKFRQVTTSQVAGNYQPVVGDFDGNGSDDILWYAPGSAADSVWFSHAGSFSLKVRQRIDGAYQPVAGNFDAKIGTDIYWYNPAGPDPMWLSTGNRNLGHVLARDMPALAPGSHPAVATNVDGTGGDDLVWFATGRPSQIWESHTKPFDTVRSANL